MLNVPKSSNASSGGGLQMTTPGGTGMPSLANEGSMTQGSQMELRRQISSTDMIRRSSDPAILMGKADLKLAVKIYGKEERENSKKMSTPQGVGGTGAGAVEADEKANADEHDHTELERDETLRDDFQFNHEGLSDEEAKKLLERYGPNELPEKSTPKWLIFLSQFWQPMPCMIWAAAAIELGIANYIDMGILLLIQLCNGSISFYETVKAGDAVAALKASLKPSATVKRDGQWKTINAREVVPGDLVSLGVGQAIPADCRLNHGEIEVDQSALTGESMTVTFYTADSVKMGSTVARGETEATVEYTGADTTFGKTAALLGGDSKVSNLQKILMKIMIVLVIISLTLCLINFGYLLGKKVPVIEALSFTVVILVASIPLAIEIVTTTTLALGSKELSKHGAIVSRLAAIEDLAGMSILCSDKTGTLTLNKMMIQPDTPAYIEGETQQSILRYAAMAAKWKEPPKDALDTLTLNAVDLKSLDHMEQLAYVPFDPIVKRTEGTVKDTKTGEQFKTTKGAPHVLLKLCGENCPPHLAEKIEHDVKSLGTKGIRCLAVARSDPQDINKWVMLGLLTFLDPPRPDTKDTIINARKSGVLVKMITGDHYLIAKNMAAMLELGDNIYSADVLPLLDPVTKKKPDDLSKNYGYLCLKADGFGQVFPEHKFLIVECLREMGYKTGMTGDGVNDAPALKQADVGIAVQGATDAARAAAHIVLTEPGLSTIVDGIVIARRVFMRIRNFINYRVAATLQLLVFFFIGTFAFRPVEYDSTWPEFFHMPVLMLMLITLLNDGTLIAIGYDTVTPAKTPMKWNLAVIFTMGSVLAGVACLSSLILVYLLLDSHNLHGFMVSIGLSGVTYGQITTSIYLKVAVSDFLTLFSSRTGGDWFWSAKPANLLLGAASIAITSSLILALAWPESSPDGIDTVGLAYHPPATLVIFVLIYCIFWWFLQDAAKVFVHRYMEKYNIFKINENGQVTQADIDRAAKDNQGISGPFE